MQLRRLSPMATQFRLVTRAQAYLLSLMQGPQHVLYDAMGVLVHRECFDK